MIDVEVLPYRVEWRPDLSTRWQLITTEATREEADEAAGIFVGEHGGYGRLITQHVIAASPRPGVWEPAP